MKVFSKVLLNKIVLLSVTVAGSTGIWYATHKLKKENDALKITSNNIYFEGKQITKSGNVYCGAYFPTRNVIVFIQTEKLIPDSLIEDFEEVNYKINNDVFLYDLNTKKLSLLFSTSDTSKTKGYKRIIRIVPSNDEKSFYFNTERLGETAGGCLQYVFNYTFDSKRVSYICTGTGIDIVKDGKYKDCFITVKSGIVEGPCFGRYWYKYLINPQGKIIGCVGNENANVKAILKDITFIKSPFCEAVELLDSLYKEAMMGLRFINQFQQDRNADIANKIELQKTHCNSIMAKMSDTDSDSYSDSLAYKWVVAKKFFEVYGNYNIPFQVVDVSEQGFDIIDKDNVYYKYTIKVKNLSGKTIIKTRFLKENQKEQDNSNTKMENPRVIVQYKNSVKKLEVIDFFTPVVYNGIWRDGEIKEFPFQFFHGDFHKIHFEYTPEQCILNIPIIAEDPTGYAYVGNIVNHSIIDDWRKFQVKIGLHPQIIKY